MTEQQLCTSRVYLDKLNLAGQYKIVLKLKQGAFGTVYLAKNKQGREFAVKISKQKTSDELEIERDIYNALQVAGSPPGFVRVQACSMQLYETGNDYVQPYIVMQLLGSDIEDIVERTAGRRLTLKSTLMIGCQMIDRLATLHALGYVHRDIKPDNMAVGIKQKANVVYLIDFGLAKRVDTNRVEPKFTGATVGTYRYMSVNSHKGLDLSKRDDIETLSYVLMFLIEGKLPWQGIPINTKQGIDQIRGLKESVNKKSFTKNVPEQVFDMLRYARQLKYTENPDYGHLRQLMEKAMKRSSIKNDGMFEWINPEELQNAIEAHRKISPEKYKQPNKPKSPKRKSVKKLSPKKVSPEKPTQLDKEILAVFKFCNQADKQSAVVQLKDLQQTATINAQKHERPSTALKQKGRPENAKLLIKPQTRLGARTESAYRGPRIVVNVEAKYKI